MAESVKKPIRFGIKNVYYAKITVGEDGNITYEKPKKWEGARSISLDPEGEQETYYADDGAYVVTNTNNGYTGTLTMAYTPDSVKTDLFGYVDCGGVLVEDANRQPSEFALIAQFEEDNTQARRIWYRVTPSRPSFTANTKEDTIAVDEDEVPITVVPVESGDMMVIHGKIAKGATGYDTLLTTAPTLPTETKA